MSEGTLSAQATEQILFDHVRDGNMNVQWDESKDPPEAKFSITERGKRLVEDMIREVAEVNDEE